jgi:hypothetical protein
MIVKTHMSRRMATVIALAASVAALAVPTAQAKLDANVTGARSVPTVAGTYGPRDGWFNYAVSLTKRDANAVIAAPSPDTRDAALQAHSPVVTLVSPNGFDWGDFGIGFAAAVGALLLLAGLAAGMREVRQARHRMGTI